MVFRKGSPGSRKGAGRTEKISAQHQAFIVNYLITGNGKEAATIAGFKNPSTAACLLLSGKRCPKVKEELDRQLKERDARAIKTADDVLRYIHTGMFFNPLDFFEPGADGSWLISEENFKKIPPAIGCLIEEMAVKRTMNDETGEESITYHVKLVSKTTMASLAARHQLTTRFETTNQISIDWFGMHEQSRTLPLNDPVQSKIANSRSNEIVIIEQSPPAITNGDNQ